MRYYPVFVLLIAVSLAGCSGNALPPIAVKIPTRAVDYQREVKPILDKRCAVCHSCYNSPCQLKLSEFEGLDRGATKKAVYDGARLRTMDPTRLFVDAQDFLLRVIKGCRLAGRHAPIAGGGGKPRLAFRAHHVLNELEGHVLVLAG